MAALSESICPPCVRGQHAHCYNIQLADAGPAGRVCECSHLMTPQQHREEFTGALYRWLEFNGVTFAGPFDCAPFTAVIDLNRLKIGMVDLIEAFGGDYR